MGQHGIKTWSKTQALIAKSSAESEFYGVVKASCEAFGSLTLAEELGQEMKAIYHVDAAAAKGIVERAGRDRVRHIDVNILWLQEQEVRGRVPLSQIDGTRSPAELMTKHLESTKTAIHLNTMNLVFKDGHAEAAAHLHAMKAIDERETASQRKIVTLL